MTTGRDIYNEARMLAQEMGDGEPWPLWEYITPLERSAWELAAAERAEKQIGDTHGED